MKKIVIVILIGIIIGLSIGGLLYYRAYKRATYIPPPLDTYEITKECKTYRLASIKEWEDRGFLVSDDIASSEGSQFSIKEKEICFDNIDCKKECQNMGFSGSYVGRKVDFINGILKCSCEK